jgi:hypothetical protein
MQAAPADAVPASLYRLTDLTELTDFKTNILATDLQIDFVRLWLFFTDKAIFLPQYLSRLFGTSTAAFYFIRFLRSISPIRESINNKSPVNDGAFLYQFYFFN